VAKRPGRNGITLAELAMTTLLLGIISSVGYVTFSNGIETQTAKTGIGQVAYAARQARHHARTKGVVTSLNLTTGSNTYDIVAGGQSLTNINNLGATSGKLPQDIKIISSTCGNLYFDVDGTLTDSAGDVIYSDCNVTVGYSGGNQETITIKGKTGNVEYN